MKITLSEIKKLTRIANEESDNSIQTQITEAAKKGNDYVEVKALTSTQMDSLIQEGFDILYIPTWDIYKIKWS